VFVLLGWVVPSDNVGVTNRWRRMSLVDWLIDPFTWWWYWVSLLVEIFTLPRFYDIVNLWYVLFDFGYMS